MNDNSIMRQAQRNKRDEFYTLTEDIDNELRLYMKQFCGKTVFMPCDTIRSNFVRYMDFTYDGWRPGR